VAKRTHSGRFLGWAVLAASLLVQTVSAQAENPRSSDRRLEYYAEKLGLQPEQREAIARILSTDRQLAEIDRSRYQGDSTALRQATIQREAETKKEIAAVLNQDQKQLFANLKPVHRLGLGVMELTTRLHLDASQGRQIEQILTESRLRDLRDQIRKAGDNPEARKAATSEMRQEMERVDQQIESILTKEQKQEYEKFKDERRQQMEERRSPDTQK
jgi:hypothetical protein